MNEVQNDLAVHDDIVDAPGWGDWPEQQAENEAQQQLHQDDRNRNL